MPPSLNLTILTCPLTTIQTSVAALPPGEWFGFCQSVGRDGPGNLNAGIRTFHDHEKLRSSRGEYGVVKCTFPVSSAHRREQLYEFLRFCFAATPLAFDAARTLDREIVRTHWFTPAQLAERAPQHRSRLVMRAIDDYVAGARHPLDLLHDFLRD